MKNKIITSGLYAIIGGNIPQATFKEQLQHAINCGATIIQYRNKNAPFAEALKQAQLAATLCKQHNILFIVNDNIKLCQLAAADGIHLGVTDTDITIARALLGKSAIIGATCHNSLELAQTAINKGASYLAFGSIFSSATKPNAAPAQLKTISSAKSKFNCPIIAIGGINLSNVATVKRAGADLIAVASGLFHGDLGNTALSWQQQLKVQQFN